jgi:hypothetical protein
VASEQSTINGNVIALDKDESIIAKIISNIGQSYEKRPSICFLEEEDQETLRDHAVNNGWTTYVSSQKGEFVNLKKGILLLDPSEYRGLNAPFAITAPVEIGCEVKS